MSLAQWLIENQTHLKTAKKNGHSVQDMAKFLDGYDVPHTTLILTKASGRGLTKATRQVAQQITFSAEQYEMLTQALIAWATQNNALTKKEAVKELLPEIKAALKNHYDFDDIAQLLTEDGFTISARSLKTYCNQLLQEEADSQLSLDFELKPEELEESLLPANVTPLKTVPKSVNKVSSSSTVASEVIPISQKNPSKTTALKEFDESQIEELFNL